MSLGGFLGISLLWTGLLALAAELLSRGDVRPHFARAVWRGAAILMVLPWLAAGVAYLWPSAVADLPIPDIPDFGFAADPTVVAVDAGPSESFNLPLGTLLLAALAGGWVWRGFSAVRAQARLQALKARAQTTSDPHLKAWADDTASKLDLSDTPSVKLIDGIASPFAAGMRERSIYLPAHLAGSGHEPMIIAHESVHISRGDLVTRPFERAVADLIWFSPFTWLARRRLDHLREAVCDAETIELTGERKAYARALVDVARQQAGCDALPAAAFILKDRASLKRRVNAVVGDMPMSQKRRGAVAAFAALLAVPLAFAQGIAGSGAGNNVTYASVVIPAEGARITSPFGKRADPHTGKQKHHEGIDIRAKKGTPVYTPAAGTVGFCGAKHGYGNTVDVLLDDGTKLRFAQLKKSKVKDGQRVEAGDIIGLVGESGRAKGPHLHMEVWKPRGDGKMKPVDPVAEGIQLTN